MLNGAAPILGVLLGLSITITITILPRMLAPLMAVFAGVFRYIGACELLPRSYARDPRLRTTLASMTLMFVKTSIAH